MIIEGIKKFISNGSSKLSLSVTIHVLIADENGEKELSVILVDRRTVGFKVDPMKRRMIK